MTWFLATNAQAIVAGEDALATLPHQLASLGATRVAVLESPSAAGTLPDAAVGAAVVARHVTAAHSPLSTTTAMVAALRDAAPDALLAVGGGSAIDTAKAAALLLAGRELGIDLGPPAPLLPIVAVPTTLAGAELTPAGAVTDEQGKRLFVNRALAATVVVYDPRALERVPTAVLATTGMNGLAHCCEAAYSLGTNPVARSLALTGAQAFAAGLAALGDGDRTTPILIGLQAAAVLGGLAIAAGNAGIHHAVCHVLGGSYGVAHGVANAAFLPYALEYNAEITGEAQAELAAALGGTDLVAEVVALRAHLGVAASLRSIGLSRDDLPALAAASLADLASGFNPRPAAAPEDLLPMLERAWAGALG